MSAGNSIGLKNPKDTYTRNQAALIVERSYDTLRRWQRQGLCVPSQEMTAGKLKVWLYSESDLEQLKYLARTQKPGRVPKKKTKK
jgi:DNA-binding transcriptional MerR regulator